MKIAIVICATIIICLLILEAEGIITKVIEQKYEIKRMEQKTIQESLKLEKEKLWHKK